MMSSWYLSVFSQQLIIYSVRTVITMQALTITLPPTHTQFKAQGISDQALTNYPPKIANYYSILCAPSFAYYSSMPVQQ